MTKVRNIKNFGKSQPLFVKSQQYLWTFLVDLQAKGLSFVVEFFSLFCLFSQYSARLSLGLIFYKLSFSDCLAFRAI